MILSLIAAMTPARVIGNNNQLPWHMPADLKHFQTLTLHKPIIMGRKTYESIGKPLPHRRNIIITHDHNFTRSGCEVFHSLADAFAATKTAPEVFIIGGSTLFSQTLILADFIYLTLVHSTCEGDTYFPEWDKNRWQETSREDFSADAKNPYAYSFLTYKALRF